MLEFGACVDRRNFGLRASLMSKKKMSFCPLSTLKRPPQARMFWSAEVWQWCGSLPKLPGGGRGTVRSTWP
jgi:hypothetical protein